VSCYTPLSKLLLDIDRYWERERNGRK